MKQLLLTCACFLSVIHRVDLHPLGPGYSKGQLTETGAKLLLMLNRMEDRLLQDEWTSKQEQSKGFGGGLSNEAEKTWSKRDGSIVPPWNEFCRLVKLKNCFYGKG